MFTFLLADPKSLSSVGTRTLLTVSCEILRQEKLNCQTLFSSVETVISVKTMNAASPPEAGGAW